MRPAGPILDDLQWRLEKYLAEVHPSTLTGKAVAYLHAQWSKLLG